jgi:hypothetical protein
MWDPYPPQLKNLFFSTSSLQLGPTCQLSSQFGINSESVNIANNLRIIAIFAIET